MPETPTLGSGLLGDASLGGAMPAEFLATGNGFYDVPPEPIPPWPAELAPSRMAQALYALVEELAVDDPNNDWMLLRLCMALCRAYDDLYAVLDTWEGSYEPWSAILDVDRCPELVLPWLAQFVGVRLRGDEANPRGIIRAEEGFHRGTPAAMMEAGRLVLTGARRIGLIERAAGNPYRLRVDTELAETPDPNLLRQAVLSQKPAGITLELTVVEGQRYADVTSSGRTYGQVLSTFGTYERLRRDDPI